MARPALIVAGGAVFGLAALAIFVGEKRRPLRRSTQAELRRSIANAVLGAMSMAVIALVERPVTGALARQAEKRRRGIVQRLPAPAWARDAAAVLLMDYATYWWHVATHRVPLLWRFHLVHHIDLDLDTTTALRFHAVDMTLSTPVRAGQVALIGASPRALQLYQAWFFLSVWFHHSNLALPEHWERRLARVITTPRMHGIHHTASRDRTESNWSSGFALWDHLHRSFRLDAPHPDDAIGVPGYRDPAETGVAKALAMPFGRERDAWLTTAATIAPALPALGPTASAQAA
jgi:sterol desaturase/sphingolipid hydroxylase (fatty acid hydroxylase superfamily)